MSRTSDVGGGPFGSGPSGSEPGGLAGPGGMGALGDGGGSEVDRRLELEKELDGIVEQVRGIEGFEHFMLPPPLESLLPAADGGPVCIVNVSEWRCDALVVRPDGVEVVELPALRAHEVAERVDDYLGRLADPGRREKHEKRDTEPVVPDQGDAAEEALGDLLGWLWNVVAEPVLAALGIGGPPPPGKPWPRIWWCPTGLLSLLPLHAAGRPGAGGDSVLDRVVSSYTPTLRALVEARQRPTGAPDTDGSHLLMVSLPDLPGVEALPHVARERDAVLELFPESAYTLVDGDDATRPKVAAELGRHRYVHLCCHGRQDLADPSSGGVVLEDGVLTVAEIGNRPYVGELAFLSACKTATGGVRLPDEAITLAAALHYAGFRQVVATLWSVYDEDAADVAQAVYRRLAGTDRRGHLDTDLTAIALHDAVRDLRSRHPDRPSVWTPFVHVGP